MSGALKFTGSIHRTLALPFFLLVQMANPYQQLFVFDYSTTALSDSSFVTDVFNYGYNKYPEHPPINAQRQQNSLCAVYVHPSYFVNEGFDFD